MLGAVAGLQQRTLRRVTAERTERSARRGLWTARQAAHAVCAAGSSARKRLCARCWQAATLERALAGALRASQAKEGRARGPRYFNGAGRALQPRRWVRGCMCNPRRQSATTLTALTGASLAFFCAVLLRSGDRSARASAEPLGCAHTFESSTKQQLLRSTLLKRGAGCNSDCAHAHRRMTTLATVRLRLAAI